jgi:hypothetical protein
MLYKLYDIKIEISALNQNEPVASMPTVNSKEAVGEQIDIEQMDIERAPESLAILPLPNQDDRV